MDSAQLEAAIVGLGVRKAEASRLLGVTPRAMSMWLHGDRSIPGPVEAYMRLALSIPRECLALELDRLRTKEGIS